jgi:hypothetical protein
MSRRSHWFAGVPLVLITAAALALVTASSMIRHGLDQSSAFACHRFPGNRISALIALVECEECSLSERNRAVWALGQLQTRRALPSLHKYFTDTSCDHEQALCQYELGKAIRKIEGRRSGTIARLMRALETPAWAADLE